MKILISACLLGIPCRYDGRAKPQPWAEALAARHDLVPVCPEQLGGLPTTPGTLGAAGGPCGDEHRRGCDGAVPPGARRPRCGCAA